MLNLLKVLLIGAVCLRICPAQSDEPPSPRWAPSYKIKPRETNRLTAADVIGPDGIVYPDWRHAGIPGGIPDLPDTVKLERFGGQADDDYDDSPAIEAGVKHLAANGGGVLVLEAGRYYLDRPVIVFSDNIVLRGQGAERTKLVFRYAPPHRKATLFGLNDGDRVGPDTPVELHADPDGLQRMAIELDGETVTSKTRSTHWGGTFMLRTTGDRVIARSGPGLHRLAAVAEWSNGSKSEESIEVHLDRRHSLPPGQHRMSGYGLGALTFTGRSSSSPKWLLAEDGKRGDEEIVLKTPPDLQPGDSIALDAPATERWNRLVQNACQWGAYRAGQFRVEAVEGNRIRLNQPLRIDFPAIDNSAATKFVPIRRCGVEDLCLEQTKELWTSGVLFTTAWECWARGVKVIKAGRHPVYTRNAKWCEIRDCQFDDAWYHGGGGTAYVGWERSYDCLMENVTTWRMRHAPCVQWSSSGNVIRRGTFHGSDAQWHAGWTNENLFEQCVIDAVGSHGTYGHGGWASPPHDTAHGPEGPRNVVYNCDIRASKTGLWMGGMNENWLILHNRIFAGKGEGISAQTFSFDHVIHGNTILLADPKQPAIRLGTADCTGIEITNNKIHGGSAKLIGGPGSPLVDRDNSFLPATDEAPRPTPDVPSIFQWQRELD